MTSYELDHKHAEILFASLPPQPETVEGASASDAAVVRHIAFPVQIAGTYSAQSKSWRWAWSNSSIDDAMKLASAQLLQWAEACTEQDCGFVAQPQLKVNDGGIGWAFSAATLALMDRGYMIYVAPHDFGQSYFLLGEPKGDLEVSGVESGGDGSGSPQ